MPRSMYTYPAFPLINNGHMTRMTARQLAVQLLYSMEINRLSPADALTLFFDEEHYHSLIEEDMVFQDFPDEVQMAYIREIIEKTDKNLDEIDAVIERYSKDWKKERLSKTTLAILRCAICELLYTDIPDSVSADEAVEQAKRYDSPKAAAFINGVLGSFIRSER